MGKLRDNDTRVGRGDGFDLIEEPGTGLGAVGGFVIAVVEAGDLSTGGFEEADKVEIYSDRVFSQLWGPEVLSCAIRPLASV